MKCEECKHFWAESYGDNWNEPRETEYGCNMEDYDDVLEKYLEEKETVCPYYDPGECEVCGKPIGKGYVFWAYGPYGDFKCCSKKCRKEKTNEEELSSSNIFFIYNDKMRLA